MIKYDSLPETQKHIDSVQVLMNFVCTLLQQRAREHDFSKKELPEKEIFDEFTPKLRDTTYGSDEYKQYLKDMGAGLKHHYKANRHHPEHFPLGINNMTLIDLIEMLCDWLAATKRHADGNIHCSINHNEERFAYSSQLTRLFHNTACMLDEPGGMETWPPSIQANPVFSIECFINGARKLTDKLTKQEAKCFLKAAKHLVSFLTKVLSEGVNNT